MADCGGKFVPSAWFLACTAAWMAGVEHDKAYEAVNGRKIKRQDTIRNDKTINE